MTLKAMGEINVHHAGVLSAKLPIVPEISVAA
jgi:hypothetical protein